HRRHHGIRRAAGQHHMLAVDGAGVGDLTGHLTHDRGIDAELDQAVAGQVDAELAIAGHRDLTDIGDHVTAVVHVGCNQVNEAVPAERDGAFVLDRGRAGTVLQEVQVAVHEVVVGDVEGGGQQTGNVN